MSFPGAASPPGPTFPPAARLPRAVIAGVGHYAPPEVWTSKQVEARVSAASPDFDMPAGVIQLVSGVAERRYAAPGVSSSDLAAAAGRMALDHAGLHPMSVDMLIFASASHDVQEPATANLVQQKTGCLDASVVDVKNACASFLHGLDYAAACIATGRAERVLVVAGEVLHDVVNWQVTDFADLALKAAAFTLGDAGGAALVQAHHGDDDRGLLPGSFLADGSHWQLSTVLAGGSMYGHQPPADGQYFQCRSIELQKLALAALPDVLHKAMERLEWEVDDVALCVPHQVTRGVIHKLAELFPFPLERTVITLDRFGNNAAASIPFALSQAVHQGRVAQGDRIALVCGAAGFTAAVLPLVW